MLLQVPANLSLPKSTEHLLGSIVLDVSADDGMYMGNPAHYLSCGASALNVILSALRLSGTVDPLTLLDFGCGAGRVTRWLRAAFPAAAIDGCDLRESDVLFCEDKFRARTWKSGTEIASLGAPGTYDLI
jgi:trans-aconitate methyltransferase